MGKKHTVQKSTEEVLAEHAAVESAVQKAAGGETRARAPMQEGMVRVLATYNNTLIALCDQKGNVLAQASAGAVGFKGTKKSTPFAAARVAQTIAEKAKGLGISRVSVFVKGIGSGRESAIRAIATHGLDVVKIKDLTPVPHNGPRARKPRRV